MGVGREMILMIPPKSEGLECMIMIQSKTMMLSYGDRFGSGKILRNGLQKGHFREQREREDL